MAVDFFHENEFLYKGRNDVTILQTCTLYLQMLGLIENKQQWIAMQMAKCVEYLLKLKRTFLSKLFSPGGMEGVYILREF